MNDKTNTYRVDIASEWRNVLKTPANLHLLSTQLSVLCAMAEEDAIAERDAARAEADALREELAIEVKSKRMFAQGEMKAIYERNTARVEANVLGNRIAALRAIAQAALDKGGDVELVYAPLYQQALEDIASEPQDA